MKVPLMRNDSFASRVFIALLIAALVVGAMTAALLVFEKQRTTRDEAENLTSALARSLAASPELIDALDDGDLNAASARLQPYTDKVLKSSTLDFVTVMTVDGLRVTHPNPEALGAHYIGTIPEEPQSLTEESTGTLGPSVRTITPVLDADSMLVGWVSAGVTVESIAESLARRLPAALGISAIIVAAVVLGAVFARRFTRQVTGDLPAGRVRDAVSSYESVRTLGEALRAQTHEHGNRMHTAIALLELGRTREAIDILVETSEQSQSLVDQVTARRDGDPTVGALLLGKASQAKERGIDWRAHIDPDAPKSVLPPVDSVSVLGNLIDNALDAAAADVVEHWVRVDVLAAPDGWVELAVSDSGSGIPDGAREKIFEHGFSTKPVGADGRGVGLALVQSIVADAGGTVTVSENPTTFRVLLPGFRRSKDQG